MDEGEIRLKMRVDGDVWVCEWNKVKNIGAGNRLCHFLLSWCHADIIIIIIFISIQ